MKNLWNEKDAADLAGDPLALRVYTSRLLGQEPSLVLHGGGNTSVKISEANLFGETEHLLYVKGSGWDLATIEKKGFAPVHMDTLMRLAHMETLSDTDMVRVLKSAMTNSEAPAPSVEAILHAIIPAKFVDHTHADAVVAITNTPHGEKTIREIYGDRVLYIPYVMPGFILARTVFELTQDIDWSKIEGMVLLNHGIFSFAADARESYERMIRLVSQAEDFLRIKNAFEIPCASAAPGPESPTALASFRREISKKIGAACIVRLDDSDEARSYAGLKNISQIASRGPLTPDHVLHTKRIPLVMESQPTLAQIQSGLDAYEKEYQAYFKRNAEDTALKCLDSAPRVAIWPGHGMLSIGPSAKRAVVVADINRHTARAIQWAEALGGWVALPEGKIFEVEYWELEQAKLKKGGSTLPLAGKVALVTGAASGIGRATVNSLRSQGAAVAALDINPEVMALWHGTDVSAFVCDVTDRKAIESVVAQAVKYFGGLDIVVANAGIFPPSQTLPLISDETWQMTLEINLTSQMRLFRACEPFLLLGIDPAIVVIASKNVLAPGPGAAAYSASKAGLTQLARVVALELGPKGVRVNMLHPHAVMDTALWTPEVLAGRAKNYGMTIEEYKRNNLLKVEVQSKDVADLACAMAGPLFFKTTGAQVSVDGGSDRII